VKRVAEALGRLDPQILELLSTLHFVDRKLKAAGIAHPDKERVVGDFRRVKEGRFTDEQIDRAHKALKTAGLVG
jgi:hypothetical protein